MESLRSCNFCRLCLCTGRDLIDVFDPSNRTSTTAIDLIQEFLQFKVIKESTLQWMVCQSCMCCLQEFHRFKARCIRSKLVLSGMLGLEGTSAIFAPSPNHQLKEVERLTLAEANYKQMGQRLPENSLMTGDEVGIQNNLCEIHESTPAFAVDASVEEASDCEVDTVVDFCWCPDCGVEFLNHLELKAHLEWCRGRGQPFWSSLDEDNKVHEMVVDESSQGNILPLFDPNICCGRCKKVFKTKDHLIRHINKHDFKCKPMMSKKSRYEAEVVGIRDEDHKPSETIDHSLSHEERTALQNGMKVKYKPRVKEKPKSFNEQRKVKYCIEKQNSMGLMEHSYNAKSSGGNENENESVFRLPDEDSLLVCQKASSQFTPPMNTSFEISKLNCDTCGSQFDNKDLMNLHLISCSVDFNDDMNGSFDMTEGKKSVDTTNRIIKPKKTELMSFPMVGGNASRESHDSKDVNNVSFKMVMNESLLNAGEFVSYNCDYCSKPYTTKQDLRNHIVKCHLSMNPQKCNVCHKLFTASEELEEHSLMHPKGKKFYCTICEESFSFRRRLKYHICETHGVNSSYICTLCYNGFASKSDLGLHQSLLHSVSEKPFKCTKCGKYYSTKFTLRAHVRFCQFKSSSHKCYICGKEYASKSNLTDHILVHSKERNFPCPICPKRFTVSGVRNTHVRMVHLKHKPFECGICNKRFTTNGDLNKHYVTHSDDRPYSCPHCSKSFKAKRLLSMHMINRHVST